MLPIRSCVSGVPTGYICKRSWRSCANVSLNLGTPCARGTLRVLCDPDRIVHTFSDSGSYPLVRTASILFGRRCHQARETRLITCVHSQTRMLLVPGRTVCTSFSPGPILSFSQSVLVSDSFAKRRNLRYPAVALGLGWAAGPVVRPCSYWSPNLSLARGILASPYPELLFGWSVARAFVPPPIAEDPRSPVPSLGFKLVTGLCARLCGRRGPVRSQPK